MLPNDTEWKWNGVRLNAAMLLAEDRLTDEQIAAKLGIRRNTLARWKLISPFRDKVNEYVESLAGSVLKRGIAARISRVRALDDRWKRMQQVIEERGSDPEMKDVPGGKTGLLVHDVKSVGSGPLAEKVDTYEVDTGLLKELREHEKQAAQELGQWQDQGIASGNGISTGSSKDFSRYLMDPVGFAKDILHIETLTEPQCEALNHLVIAPFKVLVPAAHDVGKTFLAAVALIWWYFTRDQSVAITTAPTLRDVVDLLWTEVRLICARAGLEPNLSPSAPYMGTGPDHYAKGYTARKAESFSGRHRQRMLFIFDEANGIDAIYWTTMKTMFDPSPEAGHAILAIFNPTDTTSQAYQEDMSCNEEESPPWHRFRLSALDHPNIQAELDGRPRPVPGAVSLAMVNEWVRDWTESVANPADRRSTDIEWPPGSGKYHRPGPIFQARAQGCWPETGSGVWSDALFARCLEGPCPAYPRTELPRIGCDTSMGKGDDFFALHGRWGNVSLLHETSNTMDPVRIAGRLRDACAALADIVNATLPSKATGIDPRKIAILIDDDGTGNAVSAMLKREGYSIIAVGAGCGSTKPGEYPRMRDQLWFASADRAKIGAVYLGGLPKDVLRRLRQQLTAPEWDLDAAGRRAVEPKDLTKAKIGRSPDDADAFNLAFHATAAGQLEAHEPEAQGEKPSPYTRKTP